jgi:enoyl-CoA hydratase/carnithine racemase
LLRALVIAGGGKLFCGGADISEFGGPIAGRTCRLCSPKWSAAACPSWPAINGTALGGGWNWRCAIIAWRRRGRSWACPKSRWG